jgi:Domain of unknown function (DUF4177)
LATIVLGAAAIEDGSNHWIVRHRRVLGFLPVDYILGPLSDCYTLATKTTGGFIMTYRYSTKEVGDKGGIENTCNSMSNDGWEFVQAVARQGHHQGQTEAFILIFRRPK